MLLKLFPLLLCLCLTTGCAAFGGVVGALPTVIQIVQDAMIIIDQINSSARPFFERPENKSLLRDYDSKMYSAKKALQVALRTAEGGKELSEEDIDRAFEDFRDAYKQLLLLLRENGLMTTEGALKASSPDTPNISVEMPLALVRKP